MTFFILLNIFQAVLMLSLWKTLNSITLDLCQAEWLLDRERMKNSHQYVNPPRSKKLKFDAKLTALIELAANNDNQEEARTAAMQVVKRLHQKIKVKE